MDRCKKYDSEKYHKCESSHKFFHSHKRQMRHYRHRDFDLSHKSLKFLRPVFILVIILLVYLMFQFPANKVFMILFGLFIVNQVIHLIWITHLEKRIFKPISQLQDGVKEIANGNYSVILDNTTSNEIGFLIDSFNDMAGKLHENETLKQEYEENRKTLIANISHDLKTPIAAIQGYIDAIQDGVVTSPERMTQYLQVISKNTVYINRLIDDLFLYSKLDMHQLEFQMESLPIRAFMADLMTEFSFELQEKSMCFQYSDETEEDYHVFLDRKRIHQAIRNIIGNAVKYSSPASLKMETRLYKKEEFICLDIRDYGPGIQADKLHRIFDRFYRIDSERTKNLMSTGLGLSIAKELINAHGGKILVESVVDEGSCFTLALPIHTDERICL